MQSLITSRLSEVPVNLIIGTRGAEPPPPIGNDHPTYLRLGHYSAGLGHYWAWQAKRAKGFFFFNENIILIFTDKITCGDPLPVLKECFNFARRIFFRVGSVYFTWSLPSSLYSLSTIPYFFSDQFFVLLR